MSLDTAYGISLYSDNTWVGTQTFNDIVINTSLTGSGDINITGDLTTTDGALVINVEDTGATTKTLVATFGRDGATPSASDREVGIAFKDGNNDTLVGGITGTRYSSDGNFEGGLKFYTTPSGGAATDFSGMTSALYIDSSQSATFAGDVTLSAGDLNIASPTVPASASATGTTGDIAWASGFVYVCVATNTWQRAPIATW